MISSNGIDIAFQTLIHQIDGSDLILENRVPPEFISRFSGGNQFVLQVKMIRLQTSKIGPHGGNMIFTIHENSVIEETRQSERFMFSPEEKVTAEFVNPFDKTTLIM
ncbi:MAG: hypothetical protein NT027_04455 [Proteobacteria bacterium]|nr:hypothetical protein [Pseudomonadota bacterium]